jgi:sugar phosphate isomerase/epimerase
MKTLELGISSLGYVIDLGLLKNYKNLIELLLEATEECFKFAEDRNIKRAEILLDPPDFYNSESKQKFIDLCLSYPNIKKQVHGPFLDLNLCSHNQYISNASVDSYIDSIKICKLIKAEILTIHPGLPNYLIESIKIHNKKQLIRSVNKLLEANMKMDTIICIENMPRNVKIMNNETDIENFLENLNRPELNLTWDTSHSWTCDVNLGKFWEKFHTIIKNVHLVDNFNKDDDSHPGLGTGKIDFYEIFNLLEKYHYNGPLIVELSSSKTLEESLDFISKFL